MSFWIKLFKREKEEQPQAQLDNWAESDVLELNIRYEEIPGTLDLGYYWSENKDEFQIAKIARRIELLISMSLAPPGQGRQSSLNS